ncbi:hypothetical protein BC941DRAFT_135874 [Chlamydoabsidia padenii]|nr:hypothetical protein BC941DRAFT_135874 [Chlamydoabsidia padenii]
MKKPGLTDLMILSFVKHEFSFGGLMYLFRGLFFFEFSLFSTIIKVAQAGGTECVMIMKKYYPFFFIFILIH